MVSAACAVTENRLAAARASPAMPVRPVRIIVAFMSVDSCGEGRSRAVSHGRCEDLAVVVAPCHGGCTAERRKIVVLRIRHFDNEIVPMAQLQVNAGKVAAINESFPPRGRHRGSPSG